MMMNAGSRRRESDMALVSPYISRDAQESLLMTRIYRLPSGSE